MAGRVQIIFDGDAASVVRASRVASGAVQSVGSAASRAGAAGASGLHRISSSATAAIADVARVATRLSLVAGAAGLAVGAFGLRFEAAKEQALIAFTTMLDSGQKARAFLAELQTFAAKTPFEFPDLVVASQRLLAMGFNAKDVLPTLTNIGDAAAGLSAGSQGVDVMVRALGQMQAKGRASAEEMMQLTETGVPAWRYLAKTLGTDVAGAMKLVEKGAVSSGTAISAVTRGMQKDFGGLMKKQAESWDGVKSTFMDNARAAAGALVAPFMPKLKQTIKQVSGYLARPETMKALRQWGKRGAKALGEVVDWARTNAPRIGRFLAGAWQTAQRAWDRYGRPALSAAISTGQRVIGWVQANWPRISATASRVWAAVKTFWETNGRPAFDEVVATAKSAVEWVRTNWPKISAKIGTVWAEVKGFWESSGRPAIEGVWNTGKTVVDWIKDNWPTIESTIRTTWDVAGPILALLGGIIKTIGDNADTTKSALDALTLPIRTLLSYNSATIDAIASAIDAIGSAASTAASWVHDLGDAIRNLPSLPSFPGFHFAQGGQTRTRHAGGRVSKPTVLVGEEAGHPEWVIPTNPAYRKRALELLALAAQSIGVRAMGDGGSTAEKRRERSDNALGAARARYDRAFAIEDLALARAEGTKTTADDRKVLVRLARLSQRTARAYQALLRSGKLTASGKTDARSEIATQLRAAQDYWRQVADLDAGGGTDGGGDDEDTQALIEQLTAQRDAARRAGALSDATLAAYGSGGVGGRTTVVVNAPLGASPRWVRESTRAIAAGFGAATTRPARRRAAWAPIR